MLVIPASSWCQPQDQSQAQAGAQSTAAAPQQQSLGDVARKTREQKKETPKSAKVFTNDNLPTTGGVSTVGKPSAPPAEAAEGAAEGATPTPGTAEAEKAWREKFAELRRKLAENQGELEVMERELGVLNLQNYNDPVKAMQQGMTRGDINKKTADIEAKKKQVAADQQAISDAEDDLRKSGGDSGWAR
jgi:hypothetical protein